MARVCIEDRGIGMEVIEHRHPKLLTFGPSVPWAREQPQQCSRSKALATIEHSATAVSAIDGPCSRPWPLPLPCCALRPIDPCNSDARRLTSASASAPCADSRCASCVRSHPQKLNAPRSRYDFASTSIDDHRDCTIIGLGGASRRLV